MSLLLILRCGNDIWKQLMIHHKPEIPMVFFLSCVEVNSCQYFTYAARQEDMQQGDNSYSVDHTFIKELCI